MAGKQVFPVPDNARLGMTLREYYAGLAMQGLIANTETYHWTAKNIAQVAIDTADELLVQLKRS